jgi:hypothetical protein
VSPAAIGWSQKTPDEPTGGTITRVAMESAVTAEYLTLHYRLEAGTIVVGIALYVASTDSLYIMFRDNLRLDDPYDFEFLAETSSTLHSIVQQNGTKATFDWMSDSLSNVLFVTGPTPIRTDDPAKAAKDLCEQHSRSSQV